MYGREGDYTALCKTQALSNRKVYSELGLLSILFPQACTSWSTAVHLRV